MANTTLTGWSRGTWGEAAWNRHAPVLVTQSAATSALGSVVVVPSIEVPVTQGAMTSAIGSVTVIPSIEVNVTPSATLLVGSSVVDAQMLFIATGFSMTGSTGEENVWGLIVPDQTANFSNITVSQTPNWIQIAA